MHTQKFGGMIVIFVWSIVSVVIWWKQMAIWQLTPISKYDFSEKISCPDWKILHFYHGKLHETIELKEVYLYPLSCHFLFVYS